jgi:hypothetical protein
MLNLWDFQRKRVCGTETVYCRENRVKLRKKTQTNHKEVARKREQEAATGAAKSIPDPAPADCFLLVQSPKDERAVSTTVAPALGLMNWSKAGSNRD